jgi:hypothetical protein
MYGTNDPVGAELRHIAFAIQRLGALRHRLDYDERLRVSNLLRDVADDLDHGHGDAVAHLLAVSPSGAAGNDDGSPGGLLETSSPDNALAGPVVQIRPRQRLPVLTSTTTILPRQRPPGRAAVPRP